MSFREKIGHSAWVPDRAVSYNHGMPPQLALLGLVGLGSKQAQASICLNLAQSPARPPCTRVLALVLTSGAGLPCPASPCQWPLCFLPEAPG